MSEINLQRYACACQFPYEGARFTGTPRVCERCKGDIVDLGAVPPAMQRTLADEQFNVVGNELRKLQADVAKLPTEEGVSKGFAHLEGEVMLRSVDFEHNLANHLRGFEERMKIQHDVTHGRLERIEAQLTALRADADKGRETAGRIETIQVAMSSSLADVLISTREMKREMEPLAIKGLIAETKRQLRAGRARKKQRERKR
jgi:hypothetical protein